MFLNWIIGPLIMLGLAWATLPDLPTYRTGVIMVGLARCIAMVLIWNRLANGDENYCAILVVFNSILQIILYSPYALLFINVIGGESQVGIHVSYGNVAISVLIVCVQAVCLHDMFSPFAFQYLGIPLVAGITTRYTVWCLTSKEFLNTRFLPLFSPLALIGLLYTILVMFAYQGHHILHNLRPVFRVFVPMILYFFIMWTGAFVLVLWLSRRDRSETGIWGYEMAVVQAFTAGSNNFVSSSMYTAWRQPKLMLGLCGAGTRDCCFNRRIWRRFRPSAGSDDRSPGRGPRSIGSHLGFIVSGKKGTLDMVNRHRRETEHAGSSLRFIVNEIFNV